MNFIGGNPNVPEPIIPFSINTTTINVYLNFDSEVFTFCYNNIDVSTLSEVVPNEENLDSQIKFTTESSWNDIQPGYITNKLILNGLNIYMGD